MKVNNSQLNENSKSLNHFHDILFKNKTGVLVFNVKEPLKHSLILGYDEYENEVYYIQGQTYDRVYGLYEFLIQDKHLIKISNQNMFHDILFECMTIYQSDLGTFIKNFQLENNTEHQVIDTDTLNKVYDVIDFNWQQKRFCFRSVKLDENNNLKTYHDYITTNWLIEKTLFNPKIEYKKSYSNKKLLELLKINYDHQLVDDFQLNYGCEIIITSIGEWIEEYKNKIRWSKLPKFTRTR